MTGPTFCAPVDIYGALTSAGFSTVQAVGAMANAIAESGLDPEQAHLDSNGAMSYGLWQFNAATYPDASKLVTGDCASDIINQVGYLKSHISGNALNGSTGAEVAGNFAANFERCKGCTAGDTSTPNGWGTRVANAATVQGWISSGHWPASAGNSSGGGSGGGVSTIVLTSAQQTKSSTRCLVGGNTFIPCLLDASQARALIGGMLMLAGGLVALPGLVVLLVAVGGPVAAPAQRVAQQVTPVGRAIGVAGKVAGRTAIGPRDTAYLGERRRQGQQRRRARTVGQMQQGIADAQAEA